MGFPWEDILKIVCAAIAGGVLGMEREYHSKPAGLRTLIMITVGSTLFSILSVSIFSDSPDRIASNVVTGVGFVGGGVIFKEGLTIKGVTTASTIWVAAAIGMAFGFGEYWAAIITLVIVMLTLTALSRIQNNLNGADLMIFTIGFDKDQNTLEHIEGELTEMSLSYKRIKLRKVGQEISVTYEVHVPNSKIEQINNFLINHSDIKTFDN